MALVVDILARAARQCSVEQPPSWVTATEAEHVELRDDFLMEAVADILDRADLPSPIGKQTTITGDGSETYALPTDFRRLARDDLAVYETTTSRGMCYPVQTDGEWTHLKEIGSSGADRFYRLSGYEDNWSISFYSLPTSGISIAVSYVSNLWMASGAGTAGDAFTAPEDVALVPRRLLEAGIVWRARQRKGLPYEDKRFEYEAILARHNIDSRGRKGISFGKRPRRQPWDVPVPDFIPGA